MITVRGAFYFYIFYLFSCHLYLYVMFCLLKLSCSNARERIGEWKYDLLDCMNPLNFLSRQMKLFQMFFNIINCFIISVELFQMSLVLAST